MRIIKNHKVPIILQLNNYECGAACLTMILAYHGHKIRIAKIRECCINGRDGTTAQNIISAANNYGLISKGYSIQNPENIKPEMLPAIVHWRFTHFVVLEKLSPKGVIIIDPAKGRINISPETFSSNFTGVLLTFERGPNFVQKRTDNHLWMSFFRPIILTSTSLKSLGQILCATLSLQLLGLAIPLFTKIVVDKVLPLQFAKTLNYLGVGIALIIFSQTILTFFRGLTLTYLQSHLDNEISTKLFEHILHLPFGFFTQRSNGDLLMRVESSSTIRDILTSHIPSIILDGSLSSLYLIIIFLTNLDLGLITLFLGLTQILVLITCTHKMRELAQMDLEASINSQSYMVQVLNGIATIKSSGAEDRVFNNWSELFFKHLHLSISRGAFSTFITSLITALNLISSLILLWCGAKYVLLKSISLGTMLGLNALAASFLSPLGSLISSGQQMQLVSVYLDRIIDIVEEKPEGKVSSAQAVKIEGEVEFRGVSFHYNSDSPWILKNVTFKIRSGEKVAFIGPTGVGKTTLAMLILGLYKPNEGKIFFDGIPAENLNPYDIRSQIGIVLQEDYLFKGSILQNITFNDTSINYERILEVSRLAALYDDVMKMPMGYETQLGEGGSMLSGGQRQRLALARALVHNPVILLLDEATSNLDITTETLINNNLNKLSCTRIVITHRLESIKDADNVFRLVNGGLIEKVPMTMAINNGF
jgi:ATP-binding cassette subfamily B protein